MAKADGDQTETIAVRRWYSCERAVELFEQPCSRWMVKTNVLPFLGYPAGQLLLTHMAWYTSKNYGRDAGLEFRFTVDREGYNKRYFGIDFSRMGLTVDDVVPSEAVRWPENVQG